MNDSPNKMPDANQYLDVCGLKCPMPILRTKKALAEMTSGGVLAIQVTDPAAPEDFKAFVRQTGHTLLGIEEAVGHWVIYLRRK